MAEPTLAAPPDSPSLLAAPVQAGTHDLYLSHEAMGGEFGLLVPADLLASLPGGERYVEQAAAEVWRELDGLEAELSRFRHDSDIARLAALPPGEPLIVGVATYDCLRLAREVHAATGGAFDVTAGPLAERWRSVAACGRGRLRRTVTRARVRCDQDALELDEATHAVRVRRRGVQADLGAIGKGYALDRLAERLQVWGLGGALLHAAQSTMLVVPGEARPAGTVPRAWTIPLRHAGRASASRLGALQLTAGAVSGSG